MRLASCLVVVVWAMAGVLLGDDRPLRGNKPLELSDGWGTIEGQFVLDGDLPAPAEPLTEIGGAIVPDERLLIDGETKGIGNIAVYLRQAPLAVHPELKVSKNEVVDFKADNFRFVPHVLHLRTDQRVRCSSADGRVYHLMGSPLVREHGDKEFTMTRPETLPAGVKSARHVRMQAYWIVTDHPYVGITDEKGRFRIEGLPVGEHAFRVWHEQVGWIDREWTVEVRSKESRSLPAVKVPLAKFRMRG
jgi:hypothetical protein